MRNDNCEIHAALAADDNYFEGLLVTAWTMAANCSADCLVLHILDGGISECNWKFLRTAIPCSRCTLDRIRIDQTTVLKEFPEYHGSSKMTFARLLLPRLLPSVTHVVYSDVDMVWLADIAELWKTKRDSDIMTVVTEHAYFEEKKPEEIDWLLRNRFTYTPERYFCAGMVVFNLEKMRSENLCARISDMLAQNNWRVPNNDQTILNAVASERQDISFARHEWQIGTGELPSAICYGMVIHYAADTPWKSIHANHHMLTNAILFWHRIHAHIRGTSTWESLRSCNSTLDIIAGRLLHVLASNFSAVRLLLRLAMRLRGNTGGIPCLNAFMRKSKFPSV